MFLFKTFFKEKAIWLIFLILLSSPICAKEKSTLHPGFHKFLQAQWAKEATTELFLEVAKRRCIPEAVAEVNRQLTSAYPKPTPIFLTLDSSGLVSITILGYGTSWLIPNRRSRMPPGGSGNGKFGGNGPPGESQIPDDPRPPPVWGCIAILSLLFWAWFLWWATGSWLLVAGIFLSMGIFLYVALRFFGRK